MTNKRNFTIPDQGGSPAGGPFAFEIGAIWLRLPSANNNDRANWYVPLQDTHLHQPPTTHFSQMAAGALLYLAICSYPP
jgi:hypothetical protein